MRGGGQTLALNSKAKGTLGDQQSPASMGKSDGRKKTSIKLRNEGPTMKELALWGEKVPGVKRCRGPATWVGRHGSGGYGPKTVVR